MTQLHKYFPLEKPFRVELWLNYSSGNSQRERKRGQRIKHRNKKRSINNQQERVPTIFKFRFIPNTEKATERRWKRRIEKSYTSYFSCVTFSYWYLKNLWSLAEKNSVLRNNRNFAALILTNFKSFSSDGLESPSLITPQTQTQCKHFHEKIILACKYKNRKGTQKKLFQNLNSFG